MGRYYSGDIEGKFWFAVQSSEDASFFGGSESEPNYLNYYFGTNDLDDIKKGISTCKKELGTYKKKLKKFFKENSYYNDKDLSNKFNISQNKIKTILEWYARLELGEKILKCVEENNSCSFEAEL